MSDQESQSEEEVAVGRHAVHYSTTGYGSNEPGTPHVLPALPAKRTQDEKTGRERKLSGRQKLTIMAMGLSNFSSFLAFATIAPFFPNEATAKGASDTEIGLIFGVFQLVIFIVSPIYGSLMSRIGPRFVYLSGLFMCSVCIVLFGVLDAAPPGSIYVGLCFICRIMDANGTAMLTTASFAIMAHSFPDHLSIVMGVLETCVALGAMCGPPLGGALYEAGGFRVPFFVVGGVLLVAFICSYFLIPRIDGDQGGKKFYVLLRIPDAVLSFFQVFATSMQISFMEPTLSKEIQSIDHTLGEAAIGGIFLVGPGSYALLAPLVGYACDKMGDRLKFLTIGGWTLATVSLLLFGPTPLLTFLSKSIWLLVLSLGLLGTSLVGCWLPSYQICLKSAIKRGNADNIETYGIVAGLLGSGNALGSFIGPTLGGYLTDTIGFSWTATCFAAVAIVMAIVTVVSVVLQKLNQSSSKTAVLAVTEYGEAASLLVHHD